MEAESEPETGASECLQATLSLIGQVGAFDLCLLTSALISQFVFPDLRARPLADSVGACGEE